MYFIAVGLPYLAERRSRGTGPVLKLQPLRMRACAERARDQLVESSSAKRSALFRVAVRCTLSSCKDPAFLASGYRVSSF